MTVLRCTAKLLKRLKQPAKPVEPTPQGNPLGEWYADIDVWNRKPFVVMLNGATGATLLLNGNANGLRILHERALLQFGSMCGHFGIEGPLVDAELDGFAAGFTVAATRDRSLLSTLNLRKDAAWANFEHNGDSLVEAAMQEWEGLFRISVPGLGKHHPKHYHRPLDLLRQRLVASAVILPFASTRH
ncbi:MAG: hypothetical protein ABIQ97_05375 [Lysobacteraceae bacterium]